MSRFGIAGLQLELGNKDNLQLIEQEVDRVKQRFPWIGMVVLSELCVFGSSTTHAEVMPGNTEARLRDLARRNNIWLLPGSMFEQAGDHIYNTALAINPDGEVVARYRKMFPFRPYEKGVSCGDQFAVFDVPGIGRFGLSICYDMWFPETTRALAWMGAQVIIHPTMTGTIDRDVELAIARSSAATNQCYFVDINGAGPVGVGQSCVVGPGGEVIHQAAHGREIIVFELDMDHVTHCRERGWQGLGQVLKSFRDSDVDFKPYSEGCGSDVLSKLGPLVMPDAKDCSDEA